jgi:hypothetical protein
MTCTHCPKTALYIAGKRAFCGDHLTEAKAAMRALGQKKTGVGDTPRWTEKQIAERAAR